MNTKVTVQPKQGAFLLAFLLIFFAGYATGKSDQPHNRISDSSGIVVNQEKGKPSSVDFSLFWDAWKVVQNKYVKEPDEQERLYGAISGMVAGLGDPYSVYMKPSDTKRFSEDIDGNIEGIGAELVQKDGLVTVVAPIDNSPAQRAGIQPGDIIIKIDGNDTPETLEEAVSKIRGTKGTEVTLTVVRDQKPLEIKIMRDRVVVQSVTYRLQGDVAIIKINQFNANTTELLDTTLARAKQEGAQKIVLDLRNNPGGLLHVAVDMVSRFIEPGVVVVERGKDKEEVELRTTPVSSRVTMPVVILLNKGSASASEILAGAFQDSGRAKVVGETSFGKGSVQSIESLRDGSAVRITIAEWLTPKRREINKQGIKPDVEVKMTDNDITAKRDPQLDKAFELLK